jgi:asparagine synthase (glutamine-hydrolysing)
MCGIAGILTVDPDIDVAPSVVTMTAKLRHRGPDAQGAVVRRYADATVGLAHSRLSILDLSPAGRQPMNSANGQLWMTYNGEVYNFQELRQELKQERRFRSGTDTEVVLEAFSRWGLGALSRIRGMFALGLWDEQNRKLTLARDPFGIKPVYYARTGNTFLFASELRALLATGLVSKTLSASGVESFLRTGAVEAPRTIVEEIRCLLPGQQMQISMEDGIQVAEPEFYSTGRPLPEASPYRRREEALEELSRILTDSIRLHKVSDVPLGVFLSGGIDSSALVALLRRVTEERSRTFSVVFAERQFSEQTHARKIADQFDTDHREIFLTEQGLLQQLPEAIAALDQPSSDGFNTYVISKAVKQEGITVALSGLGGDELFGGYNSFRRSMLLQRLRLVPQPLRTTAAGIGRVLLNGSVRRSKFWDFLESDGSPAAGYSISRRLFSPDEIGELGIRTRETSGWQPEAEMLDTVNAVSNLELHGYMANTLLRDADSMSMAHALEVRVPFVDSAVANFVLGMPGEWKVRQGRPKALLLDALNGELPDSIWKRPKMGFSLPFERWMRCALQPELEKTFHAAAEFHSNGLAASAALAVWQRFLDRPRAERWSRPWALYILQRWCDRNGVHA